MKSRLIKSRLMQLLRSNPPADLNTQELLARARKNIRTVALLGLILILADLAVSMTGQSIRIIEDQGVLYMIRPAAGEEPGRIHLRADVEMDGETYENDFDIRLDSQQSRGDEPADDVSGSGSGSGSRSDSAATEDLIGSQLRAITSGFNDDLSARRILLPSELSGGESISWQLRRSTNTLLLLVMTVFMIILIWRSRLQPLHKLEQARQQSVLLQLPAFLNELVLLLNAGLVLNQAFEQTVEQALPETDGSDDNDQDYFRQNIRRIYRSVKHTNGMMHEEFRRFAKSSGVNELMRVSNIISDNISKGAALNEKLEQESAALWIGRKARSEERGRLAETKMTLPLSIFLCVLILITVSPALLQLRA